MAVRDAGELLPDREIVQLFRAEADQMTFVSPLVATYARPVAGRLTLSLHRAAATNPQAPLSAVLGEKLAEQTVAGDALADNEPVDLRINAGKVSDGDVLALHIRTDKTLSGAAPTVWLSNGIERLPGHLACYVGGVNQGDDGIRAKTFYGPLTTQSIVPPAVTYSPVTQCNLNCIHCISRHTRSAKHRVSDHIKQELQEWCRTGRVKFIITDYSGDIFWADHRFGGELDFLIGLDTPMHIDTSGTHMFPAASALVCRSRLHSLNVSLDAAREETYRRVRKGAPPLHEVTANIAAFLRARADAGASIKVSMSFTLMRSTLAEWPDFIRLAASLGVDEAIGRYLEAYTEDMEEESLWHDQAAFNAVRLEAIALARELGIGLAIGPPFGGKRRSRRPCEVPWKDAIITGSGDVLACCVPGMLMGNLHRNTMEEIWDGPAYRQLRATVNSDAPPAPCRACPFVCGLDNEESHLIYSARRRGQQA